MYDLVQEMAMREGRFRKNGCVMDRTKPPDHKTDRYYKEVLERPRNGNRRKDLETQIEAYLISGGKITRI